MRDPRSDGARRDHDRLRRGLRVADRMPLVLELEDVEGWLRAARDHAAALMRPAKDVLQERPLGKAIN